VVVVVLLESEVDAADDSRQQQHADKQAADSKER